MGDSTSYIDGGSNRDRVSQRLRILAASLAVAAALALPVVAGSPVGAASCDTWTGKASQDWSTAANWSAGVPNTQLVACIPATHGTAVVVASKAVTAASLTIGAGSQMSLAAAASLTTRGAVAVSGTLALIGHTAFVRAPTVSVMHGGTLSGEGQITGNLTNDGSVVVVDSGSGTPLRIRGTYTQSAQASLLSRDEAGSFTQLSAQRASLSGSLNLLILDALKPGTHYTIVNAPSITGKFRQTLGYVYTYASGRVVAVVTTQIQVSPTRVAAGGHLTIGGASFGYLGAVQLHLDTAKGPVIGSGNVTSVGFFQTVARIPTGTTAGKHKVVAINTAHGFEASAEFTVT